MPADEGIQVEENALTANQSSSSDQSLIPATPTPQPGEGTPTLPGDTGTEAVDSAAEASQEGAPAPVEGTAAPAPAAAVKPQTPWFQKRIDALTAEKHEARRQAEAAQKQAETLLQQLSEMRSGAAPAAPVDGTQQPPVVKPVVPMSETEIEARAEKRAEEISRVKAFNKACDDIAEAGKSEFTDFDDALKNFNMLGGIPLTMLETLTDMPTNAHKVLRAVGKDPELAERVLKMSPMKMAMELARIESGLDKAPASKPLSLAPKPITPIDSGARGEVDPEKMSTAEWVQWREKTKKSRW